jgi:hypothetical protein
VVHKAIKRLPDERVVPLLVHPISRSQDYPMICSPDQPESRQLSAISFQQTGASQPLFFN